MSGATTGPSPDPAGWSCPIPLQEHSRIVMGHGAGAAMSAELISSLFLPAFAGTEMAGVLNQLGDAAVFDDPAADPHGAGANSDRLAFTTDSYVVRPRFFPGGNIGDLAVNGTINDLAVSGALPVALSVAMILEEGMPLAELGIIAETMGRAARDAGVSIVTGDTKVVDSGHGDGVFISTAGIGVVPAGVDLGPHRVTPGDAVIVSGPIAAHGIAVLSVRDGLAFGSDIRSDTAPLHRLVAAVLGAGCHVAMMRDPTRGGLGATLNEVAAAAGAGISLTEQAVPIADDVRAACGLLGLDPLHIANEGRLVAFVRANDAELALATMRAHPDGAGAAVIGSVVAEHPGVVVARTRIGGTRVVDLPMAEQLPRIC